MRTAAIFSLELSVPGFRRGTLYGQGKVPITIINLGILSIILMGHAHLKAYRNLLEHSAELDDWLIERAPAVRLHKKRAEAKSRAQAKAQQAGEVKYWREAYSKHFEDANNLRQENYKLREALATITKLKEPA